VGALVHHSRIRHRGIAAVAGLAGGEAETKGENQDCQATGGTHCSHGRFLPFLGFAGVFSLKWSPDA
jgi:hypothetical protein